MRIEGVSTFGQTTTLLVPYRKLLRRLYCMVKGRVYMYLRKSVCVYVVYSIRNRKRPNLINGRRRDCIENEMRNRPL